MKEQEYKITEITLSSNEVNSAIEAYITNKCGIVFPNPNRVDIKVTENGALVTFRELVKQGDNNDIGAKKTR